MRAKRVAALGSALLIPVVVVLGLDGLARQNDAQALVEHGLQVRSKIRDVLEALLEAQVAQASYLALGSTYPLEDARTVRARATGALDGLELLTADNPEQHGRIREISVLLDENIDELEHSLELAEAGQAGEMLRFVRHHKDREAFRRLRRLLGEVRGAEEALIHERREEAVERTAAARIWLIAGGGLAFLLALYVILRIRTSFDALEEAHRTIAEQAGELLERTARLERTVKELDQFAYVASHDLKAPLRGIASLATWISEDAGDRLDDEGREHLRLMVARVQRMDALVSGILDYSRAGRDGVEAELVDHEALVREVIELVGPRDGVTVTVEGAFPTLRVPRVPLQQIWMNLLSNALEHGRHEGGRVVLGAHPSPEGPVYSVSDDGPGIDPRFHERIFTLFQRLEARDRVEGTGIGLAIVKKLVEQRGGRVWVESAPGAGTAFRFTFPATAEPDARRGRKRLLTLPTWPIGGRGSG